MTSKEALNELLYSILKHYEKQNNEETDNDE